MKITLTNFNAEHYATNLCQRGDTLKWESVGATHIMVIRAKFGTDIRLTGQEPELAVMDLNETEKDKESLLGKDKYFVMFPRSPINTYHFPVKPASYAVFACELNSNADELVIYNPNDACFYQCSVSAAVEVSINKAPIEKKSLFEKMSVMFKPIEEEKRYYNVAFPELPGYNGDLLYYSYDGCAYKYPITRQMMNKTVQIPEWKGKPPFVESLDPNAYNLKFV